MHWKALALMLVAWTSFAPFAQAGSCASVACCTEIRACCGHCHCTPEQTCQVSQPPPIDQQIMTEGVQLDPRAEIELFALDFEFVPTLHSDRTAVSWAPESPPPDTSQVTRSRLCVWLI